MVELRWAVPEHTTTQAPRLQYRQLPAVVQFGSGVGWSEWRDVPVVAVKACPRTANLCRFDCHGSECRLQARAEAIVAADGMLVLDGEPKPPQTPTDSRK